jgi:hypothetical protein
VPSGARPDPALPDGGSGTARWHPRGHASRSAAGWPLSPLLANIALDPLDKELEARGHKFARYADELPQGFRIEACGCLASLGSLRAESPRLIGTALYNAPAAAAAGKTREAIPHGRSIAESKPYAGWCGTGELITPRDPIRPGSADQPNSDDHQ